MTMSVYCCDEFTEMVSKGQFEFLDGEWGINGCCGGGCYVVVNMKHCPHCGSFLESVVGIAKERP